LIELNLIEIKIGAPRISGRGGRGRGRGRGRGGPRGKPGPKK